MFFNIILFNSKRYTITLGDCQNFSIYMTDGKGEFYFISVKDSDIEKLLMKM